MSVPADAAQHGRSIAEGDDKKSKKFFRNGEAIETTIPATAALGSAALTRHHPTSSVAAVAAPAIKRPRIVQRDKTPSGGSEEEEEEEEEGEVGGLNNTSTLSSTTAAPAVTTTRKPATSQKTRIPKVTRTTTTGSTTKYTGTGTTRTTTTTHGDASGCFEPGTADGVVQFLMDLANFTGDDLVAESSLGFGRTPVRCLSICLELGEKCGMAIHDTGTQECTLFSHDANATLRTYAFGKTATQSRAFVKKEACVPTTTPATTPATVTNSAIINTVHGCRCKELWSIDCSNHVTGSNGEMGGLEIFRG